MLHHAPVESRKSRSPVCEFRWIYAGVMTFDAVSASARIPQMAGILGVGNTAANILSGSVAGNASEMNFEGNWDSRRV